MAGRANLAGRSNAVAILEFGAALGFNQHQAACAGNSPLTKIDSLARRKLNSVPAQSGLGDDHAGDGTAVSRCTARFRCLDGRQRLAKAASGKSDQTGENPPGEAPPENSPNQIMKWAAIAQANQIRRRNVPETTREMLMPNTQADRENNEPHRTRGLS